MPFWYNVSTGEVESDDNKSQGADLMGPYTTMEEAGRALETAAEKTRQWDEEDRRWNEGEED